MPQFTSPRPAQSGPRKPRNPLVAPSRLRQAGRHQPPHARQQAKAELRNQMHALCHPPSHD